MTSSSEFKFTLPEPYEGISDRAQTVINLAHFAENLALEDRTLVNHRGGRAENVAEHSNMLGIIAPAYAEEYYPTLDPNLVARYAPIHDGVEAYVGDTPTHIFSSELIISKDELEALGFRQLERDFHWLPKFVAKIHEYEAQKIPEARFLRVFDKLAPLAMHFVEGGSTYKASFSEGFAISNSSKRETYLREMYPEFNDLIDVRQELSRLAVREFLDTQY
jgi:5'-deoxynucleotidase YfbR-like HD superfamily hydrolase